ncbi:hypothetical protein K1W54_04225 [Micromonospora sp. CPCC 205371]|nr:hypothetical protein [Micromonospora sp. CPCC 205371]
MRPSYRWDDTTYERLAKADIPGWVVQAVLDAERAVRRHIGASLQIAAPVRDWAASDKVWYVVALIEERDDEYLVIGARMADPDEAATLQQLLGGGTP